MRDLEDLVAKIEAAEGPWLEVLAEDGSRLVLDLKAAGQSQARILERYGVAHDRSADLRDR